MSRNEYSSESLECLGCSADELNIEPREQIDIAGVEQVNPARQGGEPSAREQWDEKIEHLMENVKGFIRNIDVKAL